MADLRFFRTSDSSFIKLYVDIIVMAKQWIPCFIWDMLFQGRLTRALAEKVKEFLRSAQSNTWEAIETLLVCETIAAVADLKYGLSDLGLDEATVKELLSTLENHGKSVVESKAREEAARILIRMKDR